MSVMLRQFGITHATPLSTGSHKRSLADMVAEQTIVNAFTVDVEDYYQVSAFEKFVPRQQWGQYESRVVANTERILRMLDSHGIQATFYVLGWVAQQQPALVKRIAAEGHELGSHSYWHRLIYTLSPEEFREDLRSSCDAIAQITGEPVTCYRAPSFSITQNSLWALEILAEEGIVVDSSLFPTRHDRYGIANARTDIHRIEFDRNSIWEFPLTVARLGGVKVPVSGGGYFRLYPYRFFQYCLQNVAEVTQQPFVFYVHPWEIDPEQPDLRIGSRVSRFRHYVNLHSTERKLNQLLTQFKFGTVTSALASSKHQEALEVSH